MATCPVTRPRTALSFICAKIVDSLQKGGVNVQGSDLKSTSSIIGLHFFCGEHRDESEDPDASPAGLMNSLLVQLLQASTLFDLSEVNHLMELKKESVSVMCRVFRTLVTQLPDTMLILCVLENLAVYEDESRAEACQEMLRYLIEMTRGSDERTSGKTAEGKVRCKVKLLLTTPNYGLESAEEYLGEKEVFTLPEEIDKGDGFTAMNWNIWVGRNTKDAKLQMIR